MAETWPGKVEQVHYGHRLRGNVAMKDSGVSFSHTMSENVAGTGDFENSGYKMSGNVAEIAGNFVEAAGTREEYIAICLRQIIDQIGLVDINQALFAYVCELVSINRI